MRTRKGPFGDGGRAAKDPARVRTVKGPFGDGGRAAKDLARIKRRLSSEERSSESTTS